MSIVDFHNHIMPAVDDGAQSLDDAIVGLQVLAADGVASVITTPHVDGSTTLDPRELHARLAELDAAWAALRARAAKEKLAVDLYRGVELMLDTPEPILADPRLRLDGGSFLLMEFPFMTVPPRSAEVIAKLRASGVIPIIAHPERYTGFAIESGLAEEWKKAGAYLQVNGGSLLGVYGPEARRTAFALLQAGKVDYLCSDYHCRGRCHVAQYRELLQQLAGAEHAMLLTEVNPARILAGEVPIPVPPLQTRRSIRDHLTQLLRKFQGVA